MPILTWFTFENIENYGIKRASKQVHYNKKTTMGKPQFSTFVHLRKSEQINLHCIIINQKKNPFLQNELLNRTNLQLYHRKLKKKQNNNKNVLK